MNQWISIYQAANSLEAYMLKGSLEVSGIKVRLQGEALAGALGELPANAIEVTLLIQPRDWISAQQILSRYRQQNEQAWCCGQCGEHNADSFEICWQCGYEAKHPEAK